jgi:ring-1,2-phenylacetyl-CoA epoxidase subunit PaaD
MSNKEEIITSDKIWAYLSEVLDPEVPVINVVELGVVRAVAVENNLVTITITPTYSGCPAMKVIEDDITSKLKEKSITNIKINTILSPAWTTDWITEVAREKLRAYGIAPPEKGTADKGVLFGKPKVISCPYCKGKNTIMKSQFGSTACKALYYCNDCMEPFDYFKCL